MTQLSLNEVKAMLKGRRKHKWEAGETSVSHLAREDNPGLAYFGIGATDAELTASGHELMMAAPACTPPISLDWRNHNAQNFVTPIKHQLSCGSCVAFATCASLEARDAVRNAAANPVLDLSEADLFYNGCGRCCATGWQPALALDFAKNTGVGLESAFPYAPGNQPGRPGVVPQIVISSWTTVTSPVDRKCALFQDGPVVAAMRVFRDFPYYKGGIYMPVTNQLMGLHAVCVIGYDDNQKYWIVKNSWGPGWGSGGYCRIAYGSTCEIDGIYPFWVPQF